METQRICIKSTEAWMWKILRIPRSAASIPHPAPTTASASSGSAEHPPAAGPAAAPSIRSGSNGPSSVKTNQMKEKSRTPHDLCPLPAAAAAQRSITRAAAAAATMLRQQWRHWSPERCDVHQSIAFQNDVRHGGICTCCTLNHLNPVEIILHLKHWKAVPTYQWIKYAGQIDK